MGFLLGDDLDLVVLEGALAWPDNLLLLATVVLFENGKVGTAVAAIVI